MSTNLENFDKRSSEVKNVVTKNNGILSSKDEQFNKLKSSILEDLPTAVKQLDSLRTGTRDRRPIDLGWGEYIKERWGFAPSDAGSPDSFYMALGVNPSHATIESLMSMPEFPEGYRWIVPEVIREAVRLGLRKNPIYSNLIAAEENVTQPTVIMPHINMSDATPKKLGEAETIPVGTTSFGQKTVKLFKVGVGLKITDEVREHVSLNVLSLYLQDVGVKLNIALDTMAIDTLINGDQADGSEASAVIGVANTTNKVQYIDYLRAIARMTRLGKMPRVLLSNEDQFLHTYELPEFKGNSGVRQNMQLNVKTPLPQSLDYYIHGAMPSTNKVMLIDPMSALIKLNIAALRVESERIADKQLTGTYVTVKTGFANIYRDSRLIIDGNTTLASAPYPTWFDASKLETETFK